MGLYLYLSLSKSITTEEWREIYPKTLILAEKFQLADFEKVNIRNNQGKSRNNLRLSDMLV